MRPLRFLAVLGIAAAFSSFSSAAIWTLTASLNGGEEVPSNNSPATGEFLATYNDVTNVLDYHLDVVGLQSNANNAHVHAASGPGVNSPARINLAWVATTTWMTMGTSSPSSSAAETAFEGTLMNGIIDAYVNVHSVNLPGGEIRGQIRASMVPEPATVLLLGPAALVAMRRRLRR